VLIKVFFECCDGTIIKSIIFDFSIHKGATFVVSIPAVTPMFTGANFSHSLGIVTCIDTSGLKLLLAIAAEVL
jgi:hypothetical protein